MKNRLKRKLNRELDLLVPDRSPEPETARKRSPRRPFRVLVSLASAAVIVLSVVLPMVLSQRQSADRCAVILLEINPAVVLVTDADGSVVQVLSANDEGDVLLADEAFRTGLCGRSPEDASRAVADAALRLGYLDAGAEQNAVRVSVAGAAKRNEDRTAEAVRGELGAFFRDAGVYGAAVGGERGHAALGLLGFSAGTDAKGAAAALAAQSPLRYERRLAAAEAGELPKLYREDYLYAYVRELLESRYDEIFARPILLRKLAAKNGEIEASSDNPLRLLKDYWSVRTYYAERPDETPAPALAALLTEMAALLDAYAERYGTEITNPLTLALLARAYEDVDLEALKAIMLDFNAAAFGDALSWVLGIFETVDEALSDALRALSELPDTLEAGLEKAKESLLGRGEERRLRNEAAYEAPRDAITEQSYTEYLRGLEAKFGSLEGFWEHLHA